jgi:hypothetical protein
MTMWEDDPEGFKRKYFYGEQGRTNRGQALGREFAEALESGEATGKADMDIVIAQIPKYELRDKEIHCHLSVGKYPHREFIPILLKPDMCKADYTAFFEIKTGAGPWNQKIADENDQISFYTAGLYLKVKETGGVKIPESELVWAPTEKREDPDGIARPYLTGEIKRFKTSRTFAQVLQMHARMASAWRAIGEAMEKEIL